MENVSNRLKELRKQAGLTQLELAERVGVSQSNIALLEKGKREIDIPMIGKLAQALNVKPYELLPEEWQPETITPAEQAILDMIRKTATPDNSQSADKKAE